MHSGGIEELAAFDIARKGVVGETVPEAGDDIVELAGALIALAMFDMLLEAEIQRGIRVGRRDDVPARPPGADMVERGEAAGNVIGLVEGRRGGRNEADPLSDGGKRRQQRERLEGGYRLASLQGLHGHVEHCQVISHEEGVEFRRLQLLRRNSFKCLKLKFASG